MKIINLIFNHPSQRNIGRWSKEQELFFLDSIIGGYPIPSIIFEEENTVYTIIDGNQRLNTIIKYFNDTMPEVLDYSKDTVPQNCKWLADIFVDEHNSYYIIYLSQSGEEKHQKCLRIFDIEYTVKAPRRISNCQVEQSNCDIKELKHLTYAQIKTVAECIDLLIKAGKYNDIFLRTQISDFLNQIDRFSLSAHRILLNSQENEKKDIVLSEVFYRLNHGTELNKGERINSICCEDPIWNSAKIFARKLTTERKHKIYGYKASVDKDLKETFLFPEYNENDRSDELLWANLFLSAYISIIESRRLNKIVILYREWDINSVREGRRYKDIKNITAKDIDCTEEDILLDVKQKMGKVVQVSELLSDIDPSKRRKFIQIPIFLYSFYLVYKYDNPRERLSSKYVKGRIPQGIEEIRKMSRKVETTRLNTLIQAIGI